MPHLGDNAFVEVVVFAGIRSFQVLLQLGVGQLIGLFELAVLRSVLLDGVVGEVDQRVPAAPQTELRRRGSHVTLFVPVGLKRPINARD